jgi:hypothetical protein
MGEAQISLEHLLSGQTPSFVPVEGDGYVHQVHALLVFDCPDCNHPSVLAVSDSQVKLVAARTEKDVAYAATMGIWQ